jgi:hypothetical protein
LIQAARIKQNNVINHAAQDLLIAMIKIIFNVNMGTSN